MHGFFLAFFHCFLTLALAHGSIPETHLHPELPFKGTPLPDEFGTRNGNAQAALYVGKGVWQTGSEHLKLFLKEHGISYRVLTPERLLAGELSSGFKFLIMPGGASWEYLEQLGERGADEIRRFVTAGGDYVGICAGAFYATSHREGGKKTGPYGIGILEGTAYDGTALGTEPFIEGMMDFEMAFHPLIKGLQSIYRIVLLGGSSFRYSETEAKQKNVHTLSYFQKINEPAMVTLQYGKGKVFLSGPHLEIEETLTDWGEEWADPESDWPILERVVRDMLEK